MTSFSKHSFKRKQLEQKQQPKQRQRQKPRPRIPSDKDVKIIVNRCDICSQQVPEISSGDDIEYRISVVNEINDSFESEHDRTEPRLMLCKSCSGKYMIPSYWAP